MHLKLDMLNNFIQTSCKIMPTGNYNCQNFTTFFVIGVPELQKFLWQSSCDIKKSTWAWQWHVLFSVLPSPTTVRAQFTYSWHWVNPLLLVPFAQIQLKTFNRNIQHLKHQKKNPLAFELFEITISAELQTGIQWKSSLWKQSKLEN